MVEGGATSTSAIPDCLPCPFCGGPATYRKEVDAAITYRVECTNLKCMASLPAHYATPAEAASAWNRRASPFDKKAK